MSKLNRSMDWTQRSRRRDRIVRRLLAGECAHKVANSEQVTRSYVGQIAAREAISTCDHMQPGPDCIKTRM